MPSASLTTVGTLPFAQPRCLTDSNSSPCPQLAQQLHPSRPEAKVTPTLPLPSLKATSLCCWVLRQLMSPASPCSPAPREIFREGKAGHLAPLLKTLQQFPLHLASCLRPASLGPPVLFPLCPLSGLAGLPSKAECSWLNQI